MRTRPRTAGDADYLNFFAQAEGILPASFFSALDGTPFDRTTVDIAGQLEAIKPLLAAPATSDC